MSDHEDFAVNTSGTQGVVEAGAEGEASRRDATLKLSEAAREQGAGSSFGGGSPLPFFIGMFLLLLLAI